MKRVLLSCIPSPLGYPGDGEGRDSIQTELQIQCVVLFMIVLHALADCISGTQTTLATVSPPELCRHYNISDEEWSCEACLRRRPTTDSKHTLEEGCRFADGGAEVQRRAKKQLGLKAAAGPCRDPAIPAAGVADGDPITDDLSLDREVEAEDEDVVISASGTRVGTLVVTKEERFDTS